MSSDQLALFAPPAPPPPPASPHGRPLPGGRRVAPTMPDRPTARCQATVLAVGFHAGYQGACLGCGWIDDAVYRWEGGGSIAALDHAWPGWRNLPPAPGCPVDVYADPARQAAHVRNWTASLEANHGYPAGWVQAGGPIRTHRTGVYATRLVPGKTPHGGWDAPAFIRWDDELEPPLDDDDDLYDDTGCEFGEVPDGIVAARRLVVDAPTGEYL